MPVKHLLCKSQSILDRFSVGPPRVAGAAILTALLAAFVGVAGQARATDIVGDYQLLPGRLITIRQQCDRLTCSIAGQEAHPVQTVKGQTYRVDALDATIKLRCKRSGEAASLEITRFGERVVAPRLVDGRPPVPPRQQPSPSTTELLDDLVPRLMILNHVPGVSVVGVEDHAVVWLRQYGVRQAGKERKVDRNTVFEACSMSKPVFAYIVLQLVEQGRLDLDRPLVEYLDKPYLPDEPRHRAITARMVLSHTCGFPNWRKKGEPLRVLFEPGSKFQYSGEGFKYLQHIVEHITDMPLDRWARRVLFDPLGMKISSFAWKDRFRELAAAGHDDQGKVKTPGPRFLEANAAASLFCPPSEYALVQLEIMRADRSADHSLSKKMIGQMLSRAGKSNRKWLVKRRSPTVSKDVDLGLGWQINATTLGDRFYHGGTNGTGFRCYNEFDPKHGQGLVIMTNGLGGERLWEEVVAAVSP